MSDLLARLIEAGTPANLVAEVARELARAEVAAEALESRRANDRDRTARRRSRDVAECHVTARDVTDENTLDKKSPQTPIKIKPKITPPIVPPWVPADAWAGFVEMRKRIRHPMTGRAQELAIAELDRLRGDGHDPAVVLNHCTLNSYRGIFPPPAGANRQRAGPAVAVGI